jgi:integrase
MPKLTSNRVPAYRLHKQSGQGIVTLNGRDILLGKHGSAASRKEYNRLIAEWIGNDRRSPLSDADVTVAELLLRYRDHCTVYYRRPDGTPTDTLDGIARALRPLREMYGHTAARSFGPLALEAVRNQMIKVGWCRTSVNKHIGTIKRMFKWCASRELIPVAVHQGLATLSGLRAGRSNAAEAEPVKPVPDEIVDATLPYLSPTVRAMVQVQRFTGARPGEICCMKIGDIDRSGETWTYLPGFHKTQHHGKQRMIYIGKRAQAEMIPYMLTIDPAAYLFSPAKAAAEVRERRTAARRTPLSCGNRAGIYKHGRPARAPGDRYDVAAYRRAITRAADRADAMAKGGQIIENDKRIVSHWHPHQLRHSAATLIRKQFGIEAAQHVLGHSSLQMAELYAEKNAEVAKHVAAIIG